MSINLLDMLKDQISGPLAKQASSFLGESEENVASGLGSVFPALLGSVINKSSEPSGSAGLMDMIGGLDMGMLGDIGGLFGGGSSSVNGLLNSGGGIIESLLGDKVGGIVEMISKVSGLKGGSSSSLLKMAAPFLMGIIGKQIKGKGLSFLTDLLMGQKDHVQAALPSGMGGLLGFGDLAKNITGAVTGAAGALAGSAGDAIGGASGIVKGAAGAVTGAAGDALSGASDVAKGAAGAVSGAAGNVANAAGDAASTGLGWIKWALPFLLIGGLLFLGVNKGWFGGAAKDAAGAVGDAATSATNAVGDVANAAGDMATDAAGAVGDAASSAVGAVSDLAMAAFATVDEAAKAALDKVTFTANSAGSQMMDYIKGGFKGDGKVTFNNLTFDSGSAKISGNSAVEVDNLAAILKAYPNVKINVAGYTDSQGDATKNKNLSDARAMAVKARLIGQGIGNDRVATQGFGDANPVASNDTAEGRAQNRRIEVTIAK